MEKIDLYNAAKKAYYDGNPIMEDFEFDGLEKSLGLENKSYIGTRHNLSYTIKHPFIMGSLSKIQVKESEDGTVNWESLLENLKSYIKDNPVIITPKYDGCSFECIVENGIISAISSRGDGTYGKDLYLHLKDKLEKDVHAMNSYYKNYVLRGEVLINKFVFKQKYNEFVNPRSFVAGILGRDYTEELNEILNDISVVVYDIRIKNGNSYKDVDFDKYERIPDIPTHYFSGFHINTISDFENIYNDFERYRASCEYALDGFVIKPIDSVREQNFTKARPTDCVAIKFVPMLEETEVTEIIWSTRKTNELIPVIKVKPVIMDGKEVTRASAHNYGFLIDNKISVGTKVILSLAGDIIPFIYKVTNTDNFSEAKLQIQECNTYKDGCHLYKELTQNELKKKQFVNSAAAIKIPGLGSSNIDKLFDYIVESCKGDEFFEIEEKEVPDNILLISSKDIDNALGGKTGMKVAKEFDKMLLTITIKDIINSLAIEDCGIRAAEEIEKMMLGKKYDFFGLSGKSYTWALDKNSANYIRFEKVINGLHKTIDDFKEYIINESSVNDDNKIPVILTGEPNDYASKAEFLKCNPQYRMTGSWKECQIVFTNSMDSNTGKMKKAKEKGIEIKLY